MPLFYHMERIRAPHKLRMSQISSKNWHTIPLKKTPLDGTKEFLVRTGQFTICVSLIDDDLPSFGIISAPAVGITYFGGPGYGSFKKAGDGEPAPIHVAHERTGVVLGSRTGYNYETSVYVDRHYPEHEVKGVGSQLKLPYIADGLADAYPRINSSLHLWDLAAGHAILLGAGGSVTRTDGSPIDYHSPNLLVGDFVATSNNPFTAIKN